MKVDDQPIAPAVDVVDELVTLVSERRRRVWKGRH